jgi:hypothetical protein
VFPPPASVSPTIPQASPVTCSQSPSQDMSSSCFAPPLSLSLPCSSPDPILPGIDLNFPVLSPACDAQALSTRSPSAFCSPVSLLFSQPAAIVSPHTPALVPLRPMTNLPDPVCHQAEMADVMAWHALIQQFGEARIRKHQWEWVTSSQSWLPHY